MGRISLNARWVALPGRRPELAMVFAKVAETPLDGREVYIVNLDDANDDVLWVYEVFRDADSLAAHRASAEVKYAVPASEQLMAEEPIRTWGRPVAGMAS